MKPPQGFLRQQRSDFSNDFISRTRIESSTSSPDSPASLEVAQAASARQLAVFACDEIAAGKWPSPAFVESLSRGEPTVLPDSLWVRLEAELGPEAVEGKSAQFELQAKEDSFSDDACEEERPQEERREERRLQEQLGIRSRILHMKMMTRIARWEDAGNGRCIQNPRAREWIDKECARRLSSDDVDDDVSPMSLLSEFVMHVASVVPY
mmetsp:Transcript_31884/g.85255  ORF Transcript_31884/g.85255 Transcript_31884/m.85255 type:complete len:209 (-) Transcript_31884:475-1101(-)